MVDKALKLNTGNSLSSPDTKVQSPFLFSKEYISSHLPSVIKSSRKAAEGFWADWIGILVWYHVAPIELYM